MEWRSHCLLLEEKFGGVERIGAMMVCIISEVKQDNNVYLFR